MIKPQIRFTYFVPQDRSGRVRWCLEELGLSYEKDHVDLRNDAGMTPEYLSNRHPMGMVPAFQDGDFSMIEGGAVCTYLNDKYGQGKLAPKAGTPQYYQMVQWMFFAASHLDTIGGGVGGLSRMTDEKVKQEKLKDLTEDFALVATALEKQLSHGSYLAGEFSLADIMVGQNLYWIEDVLLAQYPKLVSYLDRLKTRPAAVKAEVFKDS